jgi:hypothetical protein
MNLHDIIKTLQNLFHSIVSSLKPALDFAESRGGQEIISIAEEVLNGFATNAPWTTIVDSLVQHAEASGRTLLKEEAGIILNLAKANILAKAHGVA